MRIKSRMAGIVLAAAFLAGLAMASGASERVWAQPEDGLQAVPEGSIEPEGGQDFMPEAAVFKPDAGIFREDGTGAEVYEAELPALYTGGTVTVTVEGLYGQTEARTMLGRINDFRMGRYIDGGQTAVWALAPDGSIETAAYAGLGELEYDYTLEKIAMQRAAESAIMMNAAHMRPNGGEFYTVTVNGSTSNGENVAAGAGKAENGTARWAFDGWCETDENYLGQGHRRNMLNPDWTCVGVAHVTMHYSGLLQGTTVQDFPWETDIDYWVQEFGVSHANGGTEADGAADEFRQVQVEIDPSYMDKAQVECSEDSVNLFVNETREIGFVTSSLRTTDTWPVGFSLNYYSSLTGSERLYADYLVPVLGGWSLSSSNDQIVSVSGSSVTGKKTGSAVITAASDLDDEAKDTFTATVERSALADAAVIPEKDSYTYTGTAIRPPVTVTLNGSELTEGTDYTIKYTNNTNAGTAVITVTGKGSYRGTASGSFVITKKDISGNDIAFGSLSDTTYTGSAFTPTVSVRDETRGRNLANGTDYTLSYDHNTDAGTAAVIITGKGNYTGSVRKEFTIFRKSVSHNSVRASYDNPTVYHRPVSDPNLTVRDMDRDVLLTEGEEYTVAYSNASGVGNATAAVTGCGNYTGKITFAYTVAPADLEAADIGELPRMVYTGSALTPAVTVTFGQEELIEGTDYTLEWKDNLDAGPAAALLTGTGNFTGTREIPFSIAAKSITGDDITISGLEKALTYTGKARKPAVTVTDTSRGAVLVSGTDYSVSYKNNTDAGTAEVTVTGKGNYAGRRTETFTIAAKPLTANTVKAEDIPDQVYTGSALTPEIILTDTQRNGTVLIAGTDFTADYQDNTEAGTAAVTLTGTGNYRGERALQFAILARDLSDNGVLVDEIPAQDYTGEAVEPEITVRFGGKELVPGEDYEVLYRNNTAEGRASAVLTGKGNFAGERTVFFTIREADPVAAFVTRLYQVCLGRDPDAGGLANWVSQLKAKKITGVQAASGFVFSAEFKNKNLCNRHFVQLLYRAFMGRKPDAGGWNSWIRQLESGRKREEVFNGFALSAEFNNLCSQYGIDRGSGIGIPKYGTVPKGNCRMAENGVVCNEEDGVTAFVRRLYEVCLDREADAGGLATWTNHLWNHTKSGKEVAQGFVFSAEFQNKNHSNEKFVEYMYKAFFGREADAGGKAGWVRQLNSGKSRLSVFNGFADSAEFSNLCARYGITAR